MRMPWSFPRVAPIALSLLLPPAVHALQSGPAAKAIPVPTAVAPSNTDLLDVREQLLALIRMSPTLVQVVEVDPSLLADQEYVARVNPQLAQFLTLHREVARNPDFYLFANLPESHGRRVDSLHRRIEGRYDPSPAETRQRSFESIQYSILFLAVVGALIWLIRILLENRRWSRVFRIQNEIHTKLIDRFAGSEDLLHYMNTEPGKRFLEAAPIPVEFERNQRLPGSLARILPSLQIGIVLTLLGIGLLVLQRILHAQHAEPDISTPLLIFGMVTMMPGIGFIISAAIAWSISEKLGLLPSSAIPPTHVD